MFATHGIATPRGFVVRRGDPEKPDGLGASDVQKMYSDLGVKDVVVKAQVLSGKRGKNNGIKFCSSADEVSVAVSELFSTNIRGQYVAAVIVEEKLPIAEEHYLSITYDTNKKQPLLIYSTSGGMEIEDVTEDKIHKIYLDIRTTNLIPPLVGEGLGGVSDIAKNLWQCFLAEDTRVVEINPLIKTTDGRFVAADAKVALDDDAFYRHKEWAELEPRTMLGRLPTDREQNVKKIDEV